MATVLRPARELELDEGAFGPAEAGRLVRVQGARVEFRHPLVRSAVCRAARNRQAAARKEDH